MRQIRSHVLVESRPAIYHVTSRCSRSLHLLVPGRGGKTPDPPAEPADLRKQLVMAQLDRLTEATTVEVLGFSLMNNHVHLILRTDPRGAEAWSAEEVVRRWLRIHPKRNRAREAVETSEEAIAEMAADADAVEATRKKLVSLPQFMKDLKQHVAQEGNKLEGVGGSFWEGVYKCKRIEDEEQLVATMVYVDLNPFAAGACDTPEEGRYTSLAGRLRRDVPAAERAAENEPDGPADRGPPGRREAVGPRCPLPQRRRCGAWLRPLDESAEAQRRRGQRPLADGDAVRAASAGTVMAGLSLRVYLRLVDAVARRIRQGKQRLHANTRGVFERIGLNAEAVAGRVLALTSRHADRRSGSAPAASAG
ncbi:transposase [Phycisphaera mikurensis]|uniref:Transposase IS200-like domain-containing protein n=1 Tax=Phycisphaera mikurensis (strain NBRC 102666 / KCTC 22515 / FYK2301M01) TaxID=1142394 RepID=I0IIK8_PHYMF|nr:transposase [Phycisphaera mikurensis]MBB6442749.1 hypothetical protein [Phycisphaera mikurensis]BAM05096.1 hypothetical protein PSMK_29370 [Phycisphaera mikurensis NBRC 102666]